MSNHSFHLEFQPDGQNQPAFCVDLPLSQDEFESLEHSGHLLIDDEIRGKIQIWNFSDDGHKPGRIEIKRPGSIILKAASEHD